MWQNRWRHDTNLTPLNRHRIKYANIKIIQESMAARTDATWSLSRQITFCATFVLKSFFGIQFVHKNGCLKFKTQTASVLTAMQKMQTMLVRRFPQLSSRHTPVHWKFEHRPGTANWNWAQVVFCVFWPVPYHCFCCSDDKLTAAISAGAGPAWCLVMSGNCREITACVWAEPGWAGECGIIAGIQSIGAPSNPLSIKNLILKLLFCESRLKPRIKETNPSAGPLWRTMHWSEIFRWISQSNLALYSPLCCWESINMAKINKTRGI